MPLFRPDSKDAFRFGEGWEDGVFRRSLFLLVVKPCIQFSVNVKATSLRRRRLYVGFGGPTVIVAPMPISVCISACSCNSSPGVRGVLFGFFHLPLPHENRNSARRKTMGSPICWRCANANCAVVRLSLWLREVPNDRRVILSSTGRED